MLRTKPVIFCVILILPSTQQIALISANNKAWKALDREKNKTIEVTSVIASCIESNRQLKLAKEAEKSVSRHPFAAALDLLQTTRIEL